MIPRNYLFAATLLLVSAAAAAAQTGRTGHGASPLALRSFYGGGAPIGDYPYRGFAYGGFGYPVGGVGYGSPYLGGMRYAAQPTRPAKPLPRPAVLDPCARVAVVVPDGSEVAFEGSVNSETGSTRHYTSPALEVGYDYALNVKVTPPGGTTRPYRLIVRAGDTRAFDLTK